MSVVCEFKMHILSQLKIVLSPRKVMVERPVKPATIDNVPKEDSLWNNYGMKA